MNHRNSVILLLLFSILSSYGQFQVVDASRLQVMPGLHFIPDVEGKVLISDAVYEQLERHETGEVPTVYPLWPLSRAGAVEEGGAWGNCDNDPDLEIIYAAGNKVYVFNSNGSLVSGWPRTLDYPTDGAPAFGDIDGDGYGEIVVTTHQPATFAVGSIYAFEINGTDVQGFPVSTVGGALRTPVLADLDGDGALEIIVTIRKHPEGFIHVYRGNGTMFPGWPQRMDYVPGSAAAVGDITGNGVPEVVAQSYFGLHAFTAEGVLMPGFPYYPGTNRVFSYSTPVLADINQNGLREIICGDHALDSGNGAIHIVRTDGTAFPGWPKFTGAWVYGPPSVGDINGDGLLDIAVGDQMISTTPQNKVYAWTATTGNPLPGFPITGVWAVNSQIMLADLDGDGMIELMFDDNTSIGKYQGYNHDGTPMEGWPLYLNGSTFYISPMIFDVKLDGIMDISGAGYDQATDNTYLYLWNAHVPMNKDLAILPILQYNTRHNGVYGDYLMVGTPEIQSDSQDTWTIYPNPASTRLYVKRTNPGMHKNTGTKWHINVFSASGEQVYQNIIPEESTSSVVPTSTLPPGVYWLEIRSDRTSAYVKKFIVLHP
ncbi:MAG: T9SS type A sorting domain-containing protein [Bacteroidales bacterium]|nr:T9SS type A sorting domain-containing protein [Bacteroidales bacterium]